MKSTTGTILNLSRVSRYMKSRGLLGLIWGDMVHDAKRSSDRRMSILLLRGEIRREHQFGVDWYCAIPFGFSNGAGSFLPFRFTKTTSDSGLFWSPTLSEKYFGSARRTLSNYLPIYKYGIERIRILPNRNPDFRGLVPVLPREVKRFGRLPIDHRIDGLFFDSLDHLDQYLMHNVRFFSRVKGIVRTNDCNVRVNHWNIGPIRQ
ncbi:hypothetical protein LCGC14_2177370 [marine sediment metagenome]|uniref:Uncharacterized protein n=1 Tax=marine sediment metagenome TaxID=412755 RepID=A0A0F9GJ36_9ZZZZ